MALVEYAAPLSAPKCRWVFCILYVVFLSVLLGEVFVPEQVAQEPQFSDAESITMAFRAASMKTTQQDETDTWKLLKDVLLCLLFPLVVLGTAMGFVGCEVRLPAPTAAAADSEEPGVFSPQSSTTESDGGGSAAPSRQTSGADQGDSMVAERSALGALFIGASIGASVTGKSAFEAASTPERERTGDDGRGVRRDGTGRRSHRRSLPVLDMKDTFMERVTENTLWLCISSVWPKKGTVGFYAVILAMVIRAVPATAMSFRDLFAKHGSNAVDLAKPSMEAVFSHMGPMLAIYAGYTYFNFDQRLYSSTRVSLWNCLRHTHPRRLRRVVKNFPGFPLWTKVAILMLIVFFFVEAKAYRAMGSQSAPELRKDSDTPSVLGAFIVGSWRNTLFLPFDMLERLCVGEGTCTKDMILHYCLAAAALLGVSLVIERLSRSYAYVALVRNAVVGVLYGLCSYLVLMALRRFANALLAIVVCLDMALFEEKVRFMQEPRNLLGMTRSRRMLEFLSIEQKGIQLSRCVSFSLNYLVLDQVLSLAIGTCGIGIGESQCPAKVCHGSSDDCIMGVSHEYFWYATNYVGRHIVSFCLVFLTLWRQSCINFTLQGGMIDAINTARFLGQAFAAISENEKGRASVGGSSPSVAASRSSSVSQLFGERRESTRAFPTDDIQSLAGMEVKEQIDNLEVVSWVGYLSRRGPAGIRLFGRFLVGRFEMVGWFSAWLVHSFSQEFTPIIKSLMGSF